MDRNHKILIVDDDQININILTEMLEEKYILESAESGDSAIGMLQKFNPDLILLDIMMPGIDGYEVCRKIRKDSRYKFIKIILVSGKAMLNERLEGYNVGADDYITKPFVEEELDAKLAVYLQFKRIEEVNKIKEDLLHLFSHETRTPLNGIISPAQMLLEDNSLSSDAKEYAKMIFESSKLLNELLKKTTLICHLKSGIKLNKISESINTHLQVRLKMLDATTLKKNISFELDAEGDINLNADWSLLDRVFDYLLDNAVKFSQNSTSIRIQLESKDEFCLIRISDHGKGIEPEWIDKIFDEFAIQDIKHHNKGHGLSLAISKYIVEHHGGSINVESLLGSGTTFTISLPV